VLVRRANGLPVFRQGPTRNAPNWPHMERRNETEKVPLELAGCRYPQVENLTLDTRFGGRLSTQSSRSFRSIIGGAGAARISVVLPVRPPQNSARPPRESGAPTQDTVYGTWLVAPDFCRG